jgi:hypothetical protein
MIRGIWTLGILAFWAWIPGWALSQDMSSAPAGESVTLLAPDQYATLMARFEKETLVEVVKLESIKTGQEKLQSQIQNLEAKVQILRSNNRISLNVFEDAKLKSCLGDLQEKLEENSQLEKQFQQARGEFEQKALSLLSFYNDWIDANMVPPSNPSPASLDERLNALILVAKKRAKLQYLLENYHSSEEKEPFFKSSDFNNLDPHDMEGRRLAMELLRDRKKTLGDRVDRLSLEEDEVRNEIKLQSKMRDFLEDIQRMNEDSSFPRGSLRRNDLQSYMGKNSHNTLEGRLAALEKEILQGRQMMVQINSSITRLEGAPDTKKGDRP